MLPSLRAHTLVAAAAVASSAGGGAVEAGGFTSSLVPAVCKRDEGQRILGLMQGGVSIIRTGDMRNCLHSFIGAQCCAMQEAKSEGI
eukprot:6174660-Pleurochrysis_carterae.AAC.5